MIKSGLRVPASIRPRDDHPGNGERYQHAKMRDPRQHAQHDRKLLVAFLRLGIEHLGAVEEQQDLAAGQLHPRPRLRGDVAQGAAGPETRHLRRR